METNIEKSQKVNFSISIKRNLRIISFSILSSIVLACVILFIIYGVVPCALKKCHQNSDCKNHPFWGECVCKYGYGGDGDRFCDECGLQSHDINVRIVGGDEAVPHSWPSIVLITFSYETIIQNDDGKFYVTTSSFCGGTLINRRTVVTAAHCIMKKIYHNFGNNSFWVNVTENIYYPNFESMYKVNVGADYLVRETVNMKFTDVYIVEKIIIHEDYDEESISNDIAILKLNSIVDLNENVQIACLPNSKNDSFPPQNASGVVAGWGSVQEEGPISNRLKNVRISIQNETFCNYSNPEPTNWESKICAGYLEGGKDTCQGDSGGPFYIMGKVNAKDKYILSGITSYGEGCARKNLAGIYTNTKYYLNWIEKNSKF